MFDVAFIIWNTPTTDFTFCHSIKNKQANNKQSPEHVEWTPIGLHLAEKLKMCFCHKRFTNLFNVSGQHQNGGGGGRIEIRGKMCKSLPRYAEIVKFRLIFNTFDIT